MGNKHFIMKVAKIITIATGTNAFSLSQWFQSYDYEATTGEMTTSTGDYATEGWTTTASTTTEELTTTLEPESTSTTTTDGDYTTPDITTTTATSTEIVSTTKVPSSDLGPTIMIDVIDCTDNEKSEDPVDGNDGGWQTWICQYLPSFVPGC